MDSGFELSHLVANPSDVSDNCEFKCCAHLVLNQNKACFGIFELAENETGKQESAVPQI